MFIQIDKYAQRTSITIYYSDNHYQPHDKTALINSNSYSWSSMNRYPGKRMADQPADFIFTEYPRGPIIMALFIRSFLYYPI